MTILKGANVFYEYCIVQFMTPVLYIKTYTQSDGHLHTINKMNLFLN